MYSAFLGVFSILSCIDGQVVIETGGKVYLQFCLKDPNKFLIYDEQYLLTLPIS